MREYKAYEFTLRQYENWSYSARWRIRGPGTVYYYHRVGGPAYVEYGPDGTVNYAVWALDGTAYYTHEYQKALEKWLG